MSEVVQYIVSKLDRHSQSYDGELKNNAPLHYINLFTFSCFSMLYKVSSSLVSII